MSTMKSNTDVTKNIKKQARKETQRYAAKYISLFTGLKECNMSLSLKVMVISNDGGVNKNGLLHNNNRVWSQKNNVQCN